MIVLLASILIQFFTAFYALRSIKRTDVLYSWILVSLALFLMGIRRMIPLYRLLRYGGPELDYFSESIGLVLSAFMCAGVVGIGKIFAAREDDKKKIRTLLAEKEILLKEVHHRMKNNMNSVCALLMLQADHMRDDEARESMTDAGRRVESMFHLYDRVYRSDDFSNIRTKEYFSSLMEDIVRSNRREAEIKTVFDIDDFQLDVQKTYYVGIIVNELATNCIKHAFAGTEDPTIVLTIRKAESSASFRIKDNGAGMPDRQEHASAGSFGMTLIDSLIEQLSGSVSFENDRGTSVVFTIPL